MVKGETFAVNRKLDASLPGIDVSVADLAGLDLPRFQTGFPPQHLLLTLFGDYLASGRHPIASAALVRLLGEFDVQPPGARAALNRLAGRGVLIVTKVGRKTFYQPTEPLSQMLPQAQALTLRFGPSMGGWDGNWTFVAFSLPEDARRFRPVLRTRLRILGFAPLYDGLWVSPYPPPPSLEDELDAFPDAKSTVILGPASIADRRISPMEAWNLDATRQLYQGFLATFRPVRRRLNAGRIGAAEALVVRTRAVYRWFVIASLDPDLPAELLPPDWPRDGAHELFAELVDALGPLAEHRVRQILGEFSPELVQYVTRPPLAIARSPLPAASPA